MRNPNLLDEVPEETLEDRIRHWSEIDAEIKTINREAKTKTRNLRTSREALANIIRGEVIKLGHSVTVGNCRIEYVPTVVFKVKKEQNND